MLFKCCLCVGLFTMPRMSEFAACISVVIVFILMGVLTWVTKRQRDKIREIEKQLKDKWQQKFTQ